MERTLVVLALLFAVSSAKLSPRIIHRGSIDNQYIVVFKAATNVTQDIIEVKDTSGVRVLHEYKTVIHGMSVTVDSDVVLASIRELSFVAFVEQDGIANITSDLPFTWGLDRINQRRLPLDGDYSFNGDGTGVNAYIIDTGIYPGHEYFGDRAQVAYDAVGDEHEYGIDCNGHGTHCAGTIGAEYYGIARGANLWGVRVLSCEGWGYWSWVIAGMDWVAAHAKHPAVASMSLGGYANEAIDQAVQGLVDAGVTVSVAAGNSDDDACYISPARAPAAITVGATTRDDYRAYFSCYGSCVDIFAPGYNVLSTTIGSPTATATWSGTSMACPHVTGAAVLALGNDPSLSPKQVWAKLKEESTSGVLQDTGPLSPDRMLFVPSKVDVKMSNKNKANF